MTEINPEHRVKYKHKLYRHIYIYHQYIKQQL